jgi:ABC-2 type transport system ATP-binding protein
MATLRRRAVRRVRAVFTAGAPDAVTRLAGVREVSVAGNELTCRYDGPVAPLLEVLAASAPQDVAIEEPSLDDIFLQYYVKEDGRGPAA